MTAIHFILFVSTSCLVLCDVITAGDNTKPDLIDILKFDLRRNNDDYIDTTAGIFDFTNPYLQGSASGIYETKQKDPKPIQGPVKFQFRPGPISNLLAFNDKNAPKRRQLIFNGTEEFANTAARPTITTQTTAQAKPTTNQLTAIFTKVPANIPRAGETVFRSNTAAQSADVKREKIIKFKKFITKNRELFNEFLLRKRAGLMQEKEAMSKIGSSVMPAAAEEAAATAEPGTVLVPAATVELATAAVPDANVEATDAEEPGEAVEPAPAVEPAAAVEPADKHEILSESFPDTRSMHFRAGARPRPLSPDQMDMIHARGVRIDRKRSKGRLCHRHVLLPEGPKYDRKGKMYLSPYQHVGGRDFANTRRPGFLLPRCCNCCRKSALGCE